MKKNLEVTIPSNIIIGPFFITTEALKQFLVSKRQEIATKLLDVFARQMKGNIENVRTHILLSLLLA